MIKIPLILSRPTTARIWSRAFCRPNCRTYYWTARWASPLVCPPKIPPHNLRELADAIAHLIEIRKRQLKIYANSSKARISRPAHYYNQKDIEQAYGTGKGGIVMRGVAEIVEPRVINFKLLFRKFLIKLTKPLSWKKLPTGHGKKDWWHPRFARRIWSRKSVRIVIDLKKTPTRKKLERAI